MRIIWLVLLVMVIVQFSIGECYASELPMYSADRDEQIGVYEIDDKHYKLLVEGGYLPMRTGFMTDIEIAQKLDLNLPQLTGVKSALEKNDSPALQKALGEYLNSRLQPFKAPNPDYVPQEQHRLNAEPYLGTEMTVKVNEMDRKYTLGERTNWYDFRPEGGLAITGWCWGYALSVAYISTGDEKYVKTFMTYARSFYKNVRPPAQQPTFWSGAMGPWSVGDQGRTHSGYMPWQYRAIGGSPTLTDADRVMFLKMFYEHTDEMYIFSNKHVAHNFEIHLITGLLNMAQTFPEFRDSKGWLQRCIERLTQNMQDCILDDGGSIERTGYHFAYMGPYIEHYRRLRDAGAPLREEFKQGLEKMFDWTMWVMSPLMQYPILSIGNLGDLMGIMQHTKELFPNRPDFAYLISGGKEGKPPEQTAKVLPHTGFLTMRSDWTKDALYMCMNYNGSPAPIATHPDLLSFGLWANGRIYMTNSGTPVSYAHPKFKTWCMHTQSSNTVLVDNQSQDRVTNGGRLENWQSLPNRYLPGGSQASGGKGFDYLVGVSEAYRNLGVSHRRAVLFIKPEYWVVYDVLTPVQGEEKSHEYRWQGHFQPTQLTVDSSAKIVSTNAENGKRLYLIPLEQEKLELERGSGPITTPSGSGDGPYVRFMQKSVNPVSFAVILYPAINAQPAPVVEQLQAKDSRQKLFTGEATGCRLRQGDHEDVIVVQKYARLRNFGPLTTDGETAYVRTDSKKVVESGLVEGRQLTYNEKKIIETGSDIASVYIRYEGDTVYIDTRGNGKLSLYKGTAEKVILNSQPFSVKAVGGVFSIDVPGGTGVFNLTQPAFSTDPQALCEAVLGEPYIGRYPKESVLVNWKSSLPSDAMIEYSQSGTDTWLRTVNPEPATEHRAVISELILGKTYKLRITCRTDGGQIGKTEATYTYPQDRPY